MADNEFTVPQMKNVGGNTVTIQKVLADGNNVLLEYTIDGSTGVLAPAEGGNVSVTLPGGQTVYGAGGIAPSSESTVDGKLLFSPQFSAVSASLWHLLTSAVSRSLAPPIR